MTANEVVPIQPADSTVVVAADGSVTATQVSNAVTVTYPGEFAAPTVPAQVGTVTPTAGDQQVGLSWSAPADGGSAITDYSVQYSTDDATWSTFAHGTTATTATVTGLTGGTLYYFRVAAINAVGTGAYSASVTATPAAPFSPLDLSPLVWYDASDTNTITESGGAVSQWADKSGNGYNLTKAISTQQPKTGTATINSKNVIEYDGANLQRLVNASVPITGTSYTMFAVYEIDSADTEYVVLSSDSTQGWAYAGDSGSSSTVMAKNMAGLSLHIDQVYFDLAGATRGSLYTAVGNAPVLLTVRFTSNLNGLSFGYNLTDVYAFGYGTKVAEAFVAASPTAQEISDAETYLADKWGITL